VWWLLGQAAWVSALAGDILMGKTLNIHSASLHPGVKIGISKFNAGRIFQWIAYHPGVDEICI